MAHVLTEAATYDASVTVPDDGDTRNAASVEVGFQALADRTKTLRAYGAPRTDAEVRLTGGENLNPASIAWEYNFGVWTQVITGTDGLCLDIDVPVGATISAATAYVKAGSVPGHGGAPANLPVLQLGYITPSSYATTYTTVSTQADVYGSAGVYEAGHTIVLAPAHVVVTGRRYQFRLLGEGGANAELSYTLYGIKHTWTAP